MQNHGTATYLWLPMIKNLTPPSPSRLRQIRSGTLENKMRATQTNKAKESPADIIQNHNITARSYLILIDFQFTNKVAFHQQSKKNSNRTTKCLKF